MEPILRAAIALAARKHHGQMRKDGRTPYLVHPFRVMVTVLRELGENDPATLAAAVLHDTIEDTTTDHDDVAALDETLGPLVAGYVSFLTKDKRLPENERERAYFERLGSAPRAVKLCKIADTLDNLRDARAPGSGGDLEKTLGKARRLVATFESDRDPGVTRALDVLREAIRG